MTVFAMDAETEAQLRNIAAELHKPVSDCLKEAVQQFIEDRQDYLTAVTAVARNEPAITLDEMERRLGMGC
ncbi:MAG: hypothetical protein HQM04_01680 [Magnetococcales bacterium]|jgi:predicted DNA-binding protein|nr:hypothetical protein [Magnetococcales bacterium]MBF0113730.1 hypothetical protein [Magnetococcales bacterium]